MPSVISQKNSIHTSPLLVQEMSWRRRLFRTKMQCNKERLERVFCTGQNTHEVDDNDSNLTEFLHLKSASMESCILTNYDPQNNEDALIAIRLAYPASD